MSFYRGTGTPGTGTAASRPVRTDELAASTGAAMVGAEDGSSGSLWTTVQGFINKILSSAGASVVGFIQSGTGAVATDVQTELRRTVWVDQFGSNNIPGVTDMTAAINAAIVEAGAGGEVRFLGVPYKTTGFINAENLRGISLIGSQGQYGFNGTRIIGSHTGKTILSLVGSLYCHIHGIVLEGDTSNRPKTALLLGRSSSDSAGSHKFTQVIIGGYFSVAGLYNIASENNDFYGVSILTNAAPIAAAYFCQGDTYGIGGLTGSSMEANNFFGGDIGNIDSTAGSSAIFIDAGAGTGHFNFYGTFLVKRGGGGGDSFIKIRLGASDGQDTEFPINFHDVVGEISAVAPSYGMHITSSGAVRILAGLTAKNLRLQTPTTNHIYCDGPGVYLIGADISSPYRASGTLPSVFYRLDASKLELLSESSITISIASGCDIRSNVTPSITTNTGSVIRNLSGTIYSIPALTSRLVELSTSATYGATVNIDATAGNEFKISVGNGSAFTIANPTNSATGQRITLTIQNNSGGVMGAVTWGANYRMSAWTSPATGFSRAIDFRFDGSNWIEKSRTPADIPN